MEEQSITSKDNPRIKAAVKLKNSPRARREAGVFVAEGLRLVSDATANDYCIPEVFYTASIMEKHPQGVKEVLSRCERSYLVTNDIMLKLSDTVSPQGIVALLNIPQYSLANCEDGLYIALENTADPSNLGAIARSAEAFGAKGIIVSASCCDPFAPKSLRAGMGALLRLPIYIVSDLKKELSRLHSSGARLYASVVSGTATNICYADKTSKKILLIGNEANGLTDDIISLCDYKVTIPMVGRAESLNAATAATVLIWEMQKGGC